MTQYAYARVSSKSQNLARQLDGFAAMGITKNHIYSDKLSGKDFERSNYEKLISKLKKGDLLVISSLDRLSRNYDMILREWTHITKNLCADILVLDMPLLDTRSRTGDLTADLSPTWCFKCSPMWRKRSAKTPGSANAKALLPQKSAVSGSDAPPSPSRTPFRRSSANTSKKRSPLTRRSLFRT